MFVLKQIRDWARTDRTALVNRDERLSFAELDARSEAFAMWLLEQFGDDRTPVVIYGHKETNFLPCIYGALKAGRGYVPVDLVMPRQRVGEIIEDVAPKVVVDFSGEGFDTGATVIDGEKLGEILSHTPPERVEENTWISGDTPAYILFTSGSTGKPKGVPITVQNLTNFYEGLLPHMAGKEEGVILNQISYSFDVSCCSLYVGMGMGMTLFTVDKEMTEDVGMLFSWLQKSCLAIWVSTPSFAELCTQSKAFSQQLLPLVEQFLFCGEVLTHKLCGQLAERFPAAEVWNTYGPTEATVLVSAVRITAKMREDEQSIPIGFPLEEVELRVVDEEGTAVRQDGVCGELLIISDSVSPGYHHRPDMTDKIFFTDAETGKRGYRTGDRCYQKDGLYYYSGRMDNQLKLNGYRVELEDIESNLMRIQNIARAAVLPVWADGEQNKVQYLAAYLLLEQADGLTPLKRSILIKKQAGELLPAYMIPRKLMVVESFPLNTNGKIDKKELAKQLLES